ncbi:BTB/POZ domain-containing protein [Thalictrum thalictroides]|uniref:BTB/POZ domain-containing protein n=1 Tax=Thalictrum thalictroides TaxID=46969 RepID=A0A7J6XA53_THATH|nr:BTB/POZ domain-containing protein [Thalictrum thalictroides]
MDCSVCGSMPTVLRLPRNLICLSCFEGAKSLITFVSNNVAETNNSPVSQSNSAKGFANVMKLVKEMKEREEMLNEKLAFLSGLCVAFRDELHTDIQVKPGNGPSISAHKSLLAARSIIFKNMLESDGCKAPPTETISLPELDHEELQSLLEFLYSGSLSSEKISKHVYALYTAADKYDIPFLQKFCEHWMLGSLNLSNALNILETSDVCPTTKVKDSAMNFIINHMEDIVFSSAYDSFALKNPHLNVQLTRALLIEIKRKNHDNID